MCVILICPKGQRPKLDTLQACADRNPHGIGVAWRKGGLVRWRKLPGDAVRDTHRLALTLGGEIVIHFRLASSGPVCDELRHPFPVTPESPLDAEGSAKAVLFQNGTWFDWRETLSRAESCGIDAPPGILNDARAAAVLCAHLGKDFLKQCEPSRWVFFSADATARYGQWWKRGGIDYSNLHWVPPTPCPREPRQWVEDTGTRELWDMTVTRNYWDIVGGRKGRKP